MHTCRLFVLPLSLIITKDSYSLWTVFVLLFGLGASIYLWAVESYERRMLMWTQLPIPPHIIYGARLASTAALQLYVTVLAWFGMVLSQSYKQDLDFGEVGLHTLGAQGMTLFFILFVYLNEEVSLYLSPWRWAVIALNVLMIPFFAFLAFQTSAMDYYETWSGVTVSHIVAVLMALVSYQLFLRRRSFLVGLNAWTGLPEDWTES